MTRRVVKKLSGVGKVIGFRWETENYTGWFNFENKYGTCRIGIEELLQKCPHGVAGDRLWVRNTHYVLNKGTKNEQIWDEFTKTVRFKENREIKNGFPCLEAWSKKPSIHMPRWASRFTQTILDIRVERLQDISEADAKDEGVIASDALLTGSFSGLKNVAYRLEYKNLWNQINGAGSWDTNPFVWVIKYPKYSEEPTRGK